ncbi:pre-mRNA 3' end processing protein WDR33 [Eurytemora carolleeae]|uniref:pre-mRNA 3' end processing protein WDR33 n=1 Tax=Eurytemora carolleeae TaxID=1294199 RepID=UPI000C76E6B7|nr:pre-mRNA 3' end processing protein WDR33 [Eurytemora carolleeae]|eukprot:XP_023336441.1 pre-mRNA 3' end processing protein WDR33-like [Eurytemora affinis]
MKWSSNDSWMVTGDHGGYIKYWQSNMNNVKMFQAHKEPVRQVAFCPTDTKFASCSDDGTVRIWDFQRCMEERVLRGHGSDVKCCDWHPQKGIVVSGSKDNQQPLKLWDPRNGTVLTTIHAHKSTVMDCRFNRNGNWLLTASRDHLLKLFDIRNMKEEVQTFRGHKKEASAVAWHPIHEGLFCSGGSDGSVIFWHVDQEKEVGQIEQAHESIVWTLVWHPVGHILTTGSNDHTVKFWSRNRPGDPMRDKYNLNTLPAGVEEDTGNIGDINDTKPGVDGVGVGSSSIPGMGGVDRTEKQDFKLSIPGLDVQGAPEEPSLKKTPFVKPISRTFQSSWNEPKTEDRGVKRLYGERESSNLPLPSQVVGAGVGPTRGVGAVGVGPLDPRRNEVTAQPTAITLSQLQQEATAVVALGQIIPVLPGGPLYQSIGAGEMAIRDTLLRSNIWF